MTSLEEIIEDINDKIRVYQKCLDNKDFAPTDSEYHIEVRKDYLRKKNIYIKILRYLKKEKSNEKGI